MSQFFQRFLAVFQETPVHVSLISDKWIFISGNIDNVGSLKSRVETIPNLYGAKGIRYSGENELALFLAKLNAAGVRFLEDRKHENCPHSIMNDLRDDGLVVAEFASVSWTGHGFMKTMVSRETSSRLLSNSLSVASCSPKVDEH